MTIVHNLNVELVDVAAYDTANNVVQVGVRVIDPNTVEITTDSGLPFSGKVLVH